MTQSDKHNCECGPKAEQVLKGSLRTRVMNLDATLSELAPARPAANLRDPDANQSLTLEALFDLVKQKRVRIVIEPMDNN
jgi:hypothetical protein